LNKNTMIGVGVGLAVGLVVGYSVGASLATERPPAPLAAAPAPGAPAGAAPSMPVGSLEAQQRIIAAQQLVARDPKNLQAWIELGNDYFDTHQRQKAIEAYGRALELDPSNPNVLTDQGVMYREIGSYDMAIANFEKANKVDPRHMQSLFNLGVVYAYDLKDVDKAVTAWSRIIKADPASPQAAEARKALDDVKAHPPAR
jgi:tetratricopeptide (TPR) repeat protein